ncbi:MAG: uracil-DNA glycosylase family protein [Pseudomonadota bacterium]
MTEHRQAAIGSEERLGELECRIRACALCKGDMPNTPNPIFQVSSTARILIASQAPGNLAHQSGKPFDDPSGRRLRSWMGITDEAFYDASRVAIVPMGFCFPGYDGKGGDLPPMKRCAAAWRPSLLAELPSIEITLLVGAYSQRWHLGYRSGRTLAETVGNWRDFVKDGLFPTPHPSWRNNAWLKRHPWFENDLLPVLQASVRSSLQRS